MKSSNAQCGHNLELLFNKTGGAYSYHEALKC